MSGGGGTGDFWPLTAARHAAEQSAALGIARPEVASIYWGRAVCLEELKRLTKAREAVADLIEEVGTGATATQRGYVAQAYLLQARTAEARGRFDEASKATEAAIAQCSGGNDPELMTMRQEAEHAQQALQWRLRSTR